MAAGKPDIKQAVAKTVTEILNSEGFQDVLWENLPGDNPDGTTQIQTVEVFDSSPLHNTIRITQKDAAPRYFLVSVKEQL